MVLIMIKLYFQDISNVNQIQIKLPKMNKIKCLFFSLFCLFSLLVNGQKSVESEIIQLSKLKNQWMMSRDSGSLKKVFHKQLLYIHSSNKIDDYEAMMGSLANMEVRIVKQDLSEPVVRTEKNAAVLTGKLTLGLNISGKSSELNLLITEVWIKKGKKWMLWSRHGTRLSP